MVEVISLLLPVGIMLFVGALVAAAAVRIAPEHERLVVLRLGRFLGVSGPGLLFLIPFVDRAVVVDLREQVGRIESAKVMTRDSKRVRVDLVWIWRVVDPAKSVLEVGNLEESVEEIAATVLRTQIGNMIRSDALESREPLREQIQARLVEITEPWGVEVRDVEIREIGRA